MNAKDLVFVDQMNVARTQLGHTDVFLRKFVVIQDMKELGLIAKVMKIRNEILYCQILFKRDITSLVVLLM
jgi:hypothetical protein